MKKIFVVSTIIVIFFSCSPKKNTWLSRTYQGITTKYNIHFNANTSFQDGMNAFQKSNKDDFSAIIPMYPIVNKETSSPISSKMDITIEKCRKSIKLHSITKKPSKKPAGMNKSEWKKYRQQSEFNSQIPKAWLLLGKAEYYKNESAAAIAAFNYIIKHYKYDEDLVMEANLWKIFVYTSMGWLNDAESNLDDIKESDVPNSLKGEYNAFKANLLINKGEYDKAIAPLEIAVTTTKNKYQTSRFNFVLAQLYEINNKKNLAQEHYLIAKRKATSYEMIFNAGLKYYQLEKNSSKAIKKLNKMAKSANNKDYLDQIYSVIARHYISIDKKDKAIENYKYAIDKSTRNGLEKAFAALDLAEIYYNDKDYVSASQYYDTVILYMPNNHDLYTESERRSTILAEYTLNYNIVTLKDSLLHLSTLSEEQQIEIIDGVIADLIKADEQAKKDSTDKAALDLAQQKDPDFFNPSNMQPIGNSSKEWYFYNTSSLSNGKREFNKKWGKRALEDSWNRSTKSLIASNTSDNDKNITEEKELKNDSSIEENNFTDPYTREYYLSQIPTSDEDKDLAKSDIATASYNMGKILYAKIEDPISADSIFNLFGTRFDEDKRMPEVLFIMYQINSKLQNSTKQELYRDKLLTDYPESKYAQMLSDPNYTQNMTDMFLKEDSIYSTSYKLYNSGNFVQVNQNYKEFAKKFPISELMPKFKFINALSMAKMGYKDSLEVQLNTIVQQYPTSDITPMSKDILALIKQGREQSDNTTSSPNLNDIRKTETENKVDSIQKQISSFTIDIAEAHSIIFISNNKDLMNNLLYDIAAYNFNKFMVKDFDFRLKELKNVEVLIISGMESFEEADWYYQLLFNDKTFMGKEYITEFVTSIISESNLAKISSQKDLESYLKFEKNKK